MSAGPYWSYGAGATGPTTGTASGTYWPKGPQVVEQPWEVWLRSPEARGYDGEWVLLSAGMRPIDSDHSPMALANRHQARDGQVIVFVEPPLNRYMA